MLLLGAWAWVTWGMEGRGWSGHHGGLKMGLFKSEDVQQVSQLR